MMLLNRRTSFLVMLTIPLLAHGHEEYTTTTTTSSKALYDDGVVVQEHFHAPLDSFLITNMEDDDPNEHSHLRRELQTNPVCRATQPSGNTLVCGGYGGGFADPCRNSQATCDGLTYSCSCSGSMETTCSFCQVRTANAIICQQSGSSTTFTDLNGNIMSCTCEYIGNGQVLANCNQPNPMPIPFPNQPSPVPIPFTTPAPVNVRAPTVPIPSPGIPVQPPQLPTTSMQPQSPIVNSNVTCRATNLSNVNLGIGSNCSALQSYACTCAGSSDTSCSYCQVQTLNAIICQVTGSDITFIDPLGAYKTCYCEYRGNGQIQQFCYLEGGGGGPPPPLPTNPAPIMTTPTSQRTPTIPASTPFPIPAYAPFPLPAPIPFPIRAPTVPVPAAGSSQAKKSKKNNKRH